MADRTGSDWENIFCFDVIILNVWKILFVIRFYRFAKWQCNFAINDKSSTETILPFELYPPLPITQCWTWSGLLIAIQPDSALQNRIRIGLNFEKNSTGSDMDIQTALITAVKCLIRAFFGYKPDWIKCFDRSTGLGSDRITEGKFWTGLGFQKSPICSTLP